MSTRIKREEQERGEDGGSEYLCGFEVFCERAHGFSLPAARAEGDRARAAARAWVGEDAEPCARKSERLRGV